MHVRTVTGRTMLGRDKTDRKEHLSDPYPGLFQNPLLLDPQFDVDKSLPLVRYRIVVDGEEDAAGELHRDHRFALVEAMGMTDRGRYGWLGKYLAEVVVYDPDGNLLGRDKQFRTNVASQQTVQWQSSVDAVERSYRTAAKVRAMGSAFKSR